MVTYDPALIQEQANRLYKQAAHLLIERTVAWGLLGAAVAYLTVAVVAESTDVSPIGIAAVAGLALAWLGYRSASEKAFAMRLQAQTALCQIQIEDNTSTSGS